MQVNWPQLWTPRHKRYCYRIAGYLLLIITIAFPVGIFTGAPSSTSLCVLCNGDVVSRKLSYIADVRARLTRGTAPGVMCAC